VADGQIIFGGAVARRLGITAKTAANPVSNILPELGVADRTQAALLVVAHRRRA